MAEKHSLMVGVDKFITIANFLQKSLLSSVCRMNFGPTFNYVNIDSEVVKHFIQENGISHEEWETSFDQILGLMNLLLEEEEIEHIKKVFVNQYSEEPEELILKKKEIVDSVLITEDLKKRYICHKELHNVLLKAVHGEVNRRYIDDKNFVQTTRVSISYHHFDGFGDKKDESLVLDLDISDINYLITQLQKIKNDFVKIYREV